MAGNKKIIILGAGLSGLAAAYILAPKFNVTLIEKNASPGGLASSFEHEGRFYPLGYHQILSSDKTLQNMFRQLGLYNQIQWKKTNIVLFYKKRYYDLTNLVDFLTFPIPLIKKIRWAVFMFSCFLKKDWSSLNNTPADKWLDKNAGRFIRTEIFDPLIDIKFGLPSSEISASWLGTRLSNREGSSKFGFIPNRAWTEVIAASLAKEVEQRGAKIHYDTIIKKIGIKNKTIKTAKKENIKADIILSTLPPPVFLGLSGSKNKDLEAIDYIHTISLVCSVKKVPKDFYWMVNIAPRCSFSGIFNLSYLNSSLGQKGETIINLFTHCGSDKGFFSKSEEEIIKSYEKDFERIFGYPLGCEWKKLNKIRFSSPKFTKGYTNPSINPEPGIYLAGNYTTYPLITSTGTAIESGIKAAKKIMNDCL